VSVNVRLAPKEIAFILDDAYCGHLFIDPPFAELLDTPELARWKDRALIIGDDTDVLLAARDPVDCVETAEDEDAILLYTGGTTGRSKGVRLTHGNIIANGFQVGLCLSIRGNDIYAHVAPMFHSADLLGTATTLMGGAHFYLPAFTPDAFLSAVQRHHVTATMVAPTVIIMMLQQADPGAYDLSSLRCVFYGSAPMAVAWIQKTMAALPRADLVQGYGLTETSPILTILDAETHRRAVETGDTDVLKAAGQPIPGIDIRIDDDGSGSGEVMVRGPNVTPGYLNLDDINAATFRDGWFRTGDVGRLDDDGMLYLLDRKKDMIVTGGENVYSSEVEAALYQLPDVVEAAVFGVPDDTYGEAVSAALVLQDGAAGNVDAVVAHCRDHIGGYKIPRHIHFVDALPKTAVGKVQKNELRKMFGKQE
jgi:long-chain acyl-CoA synthetase